MMGNGEFKVFFKIPVHILYDSLFVRLKIILLLVLNLSILLVLWYFYYHVLTKLTSNLLESIFVIDI